MPPSAPDVPESATQAARIRNSADHNMSLIETLQLTWITGTGTRVNWLTSVIILGHRYLHVLVQCTSSTCGTYVCMIEPDAHSHTGSHVLEFTPRSTLEFTPPDVREIACVLLEELEECRHKLRRECLPRARNLGWAVWRSYS